MSPAEARVKKLEDENARLIRDHLDTSRHYQSEIKRLRTQVRTLGAELDQQQLRIEKLTKDLEEANGLLGGVEEIVLLYRDNDSTLQPIEAVEAIGELLLGKEEVSTGGESSGPLQG